MIRHLGYACINMTLSEGKPSERVTNSRTYRIKSHTLEKASDICYANARDLINILRWNENNEIRYFRISSDMFPFMDHPDKGYKLDDLKNAKWIRKTLAEAGEFAREHGHRLSMHPGPYTCIASPKDDVVKKSLLCLEMHNLIAELLGAGPDFKINIHVGGTYEGKDETAERFCRAFELLSPSCQSRLTVENDDKYGQWGIHELHKMIHKRIGVALCFDIHHHECYYNNNYDEYLHVNYQELVEPTWGDVVPEVHYSEPRDIDSLGQGYRAHSDYVTRDVPILSDNQYDLMLETKMKEKALIKCRKRVIMNEINSVMYVEHYQNKYNPNRVKKDYKFCQDRV